jgi:hypothetical protein
MSLETNNPATWHDLSEHPHFSGKPFDRAWCDGDLDKDLRLLRLACKLILEAMADLESDLVVLDDCTFFAKFSRDNKPVCEIYPSKTVKAESCLLFSFPTMPGLEIRVLTPAEAARLMRAFDANEDLAAFNRIE